MICGNVQSSTPFSITLKSTGLSPTAVTLTRTSSAEILGFGISIIAKSEITRCELSVSAKAFLATSKKLYIQEL